MGKKIINHVEELLRELWGSASISMTNTAENDVDGARIEDDSALPLDIENSIQPTL